MLTGCCVPGSCAALLVAQVPPSLDEHAVSKLEEKISNIFARKGKKVLKVMQDRFHVSKSVSISFNNSDPRFNSLVINGWRDATVVRDTLCEDMVDEALRQGKIVKRRKKKSIVLGETFNEDEIAELKSSGLYHKLFSARDVVVPEHVKGASSLPDSIDRWATITREDHQEGGREQETLPLVPREHRCTRLAAPNGPSKHSGGHIFVDCPPPVCLSW